MASNATTFYFVRHGEVHNPNDIYYGRLPRFRLSETGRAQATAAASWLADRPLDAIYCSPLLRARQTAAILSAEFPPLTPRTSALLLEIHTPFDGRPRSEMAARGWDLYAGTQPPYEQPADVVRRIERFVRQATRRHAGGHVVAVTHGDVVALAALWVAAGERRQPAQRPALRRIGVVDGYPETASMVIFSAESDGTPTPPVRYVNPHRP